MINHFSRCRKSIWWNSIPVHDENSHPSGYRENITYLNDKSHWWQTHSQHNTQEWKAESPPTKIWNKTKMPTLTTSIQRGIGNPSHDNQARKINTRHPDQKGRSKIVICTWHDIDNPTDCTQKVSEPINWVHHSSRTQGWHTEIHWISCHLQQHDGLRHCHKEWSESAREGEISYDIPEV